MIKLSSKAVHDLMLQCLFKDDEDQEGAIKVEGVLAAFGFHSERIKEHKAEIVDLLSQLPKEFTAEGGGGWSFLNAYIDADGEQWGEHADIDHLICLGLAIGRVEFLMERGMWNILPGAVPYFTVITEE